MLQAREQAIAQRKERPPKQHPPRTEKAADSKQIEALFALPALKVTPQDSKASRLQKLRFNAAREAIDVRFKKIEAGAATADLYFFHYLGGLLDSALEIKNLPQRAVVLDGVQAIAQTAGAITDAQHQAGKIGVDHASATRYFVLDIELRLLKAREGNDRKR